MDDFSCLTIVLSTRPSGVSALLHSEALSLESAVRECLSLFLLSRELQSHQQAAGTLHRANYFNHPTSVLASFTLKYLLY